MATLHVIYDERDRLQVPSLPGLSSAKITLPEFYTEHEIEDAAKDLALMLLRHHYGYPKK